MRRRLPWFCAIGAFVGLLNILVVAQEPSSQHSDWPMWGGTPDRNMISNMVGLPSDWDIDTGRNIKWVAELGSQTYGNPVVAEGVVLVGTNNEAVKDLRQQGDMGVLIAFREEDGELLWQHANEKLAAGRVHDWPYQGVCSSPLVENGVVYYVSNRGEVLALDIEGFRDGENDGWVTDEPYSSEIDADVIWRFDMLEEVGAFPHNMSNSSPVVYGDLIFVSTSNGQDESHVNIQSPMAPAIIALNKTTGELIWEDNSVDDRILHGQWASPTDRTRNMARESVICMRSTLRSVGISLRWVVSGTTQTFAVQSRPQQSTMG